MNRNDHLPRRLLRFVARRAATVAAGALALCLPAVSMGQTITIDPNIPAELNPGGGGPEMATFEQAAMFAWQEFIALNWPAAPNQRGVADTTKKLGDPGTLVWETYRGKVEIFPGTAIGAKIGYQYPFSSYDLPPKYIYQPKNTGTADGTVPVCPGGKAAATPPWINLDETTQIGLDEMFAGVSTVGEFPDQQILFLAKANRVEFDYVTKTNKWFGDKTSAFYPPVTATATYVKTNKKSPPPGDTNLVSFPSGTIELKSAWRRLSNSEDASRFHTAPVRFYKTDPSTKLPCYVDETWAMLALHINHKTPGAPYFIYATFEQADNILTPTGQPVENADGSLTPVGGMVKFPLSPNIGSVNATPNTIQSFTNTTPATTPAKQLYYLNEPNLGLPETKWIGVDKRKHDIPATVVKVNKAAQNAISSYNNASKVQFYKLVNVQFVPIDKPAGITYTGTPPLKTPKGEDVATGTYYQSNVVVETDYNLQVFSGRFSSDNRITDYMANGKPFYNVKYGGKQANMGGCMGCHGNAQFGGADFSFLLGFPPAAPEVAADASNKAALIEKYQRMRNIAQ